VEVCKVQDGKHFNLTSAEISQLWGTYMGDSSQVCILSYFLNVVEDKEIKTIIEDACNSAQRHVLKIKDMFSEEGQAIPHGFKIAEDVDTSAPRLYSDSLMLEYLHQFGRIGLRTHSVNLSLATRKDCTEFFKQCLSDADRLYEMAKDLQVAKGIYGKSPLIKTSQEVDYIKHQNFLAGFFGVKRPLTAPEITSLYANFQRNSLGSGILIGFSQVAKASDVIKYFTRAKEIGEKHCEIFNSYLKEYNFLDPIFWDSQVTENTHHVFSDKLLMFVVSTLTAASMGFYGLALGTSFRRDLGTVYNRLLLETQLLAEDGANIMIENGWLESPPKVGEK
jgi:hypothetical protein